MPSRRIPHTIRENKRSHFPRECIFYDTETTQEPIDDRSVIHNLVYGFASYCDYDRGGEKDTLEFTDQNTFWDWVHLKLKNKRTLYLFAHNQDFDFRVLQGFTMLNQRGLYLSSLIADGSRWIVSFSTDPPKPLQKQDPQRYKHDPSPRRIITLDTLNWFKQSLKSLGATLGIEKLTMPDDFTDTQSLALYCQRDVLILRRSVESYFEFIIKHDLGNFGFTAAKQSLNAFRHRFMDHSIHIHTNEKSVRLERHSYYGGRTECFFLGEIKDDVTYKLDINSMYPYVMQNYFYPTKLVAHKHCILVETWKRMRKKHLVIARIRTSITDPFLPVRYNNRLCFPVGEIETALCGPEIELLDNLKIKYEVLEAAFYECAPVFREYVNYFYPLRLEFKKQGNKQYEFFVKIFMNSLYGKFGQRSPDWRLVEGDHGSDSWYEVIDDPKTGKSVSLKCLNGILFRCDEYKEGWDTLVACASFVTSYARVLLWNLIEKAGRSNVYYCDTDSLFVNQNGLDNLQNEIDSQQLGKMKVEAETDYLLIRNLKDYVFGKEEKIKGIRPSAIQSGPNEYQCEQWEHLDGAIHRNRIESVITKRIGKTLTRKYEKGLPLVNGFVQPFQL